MGGTQRPLQRLLCNSLIDEGSPPKNAQPPDPSAALPTKADPATNRTDARTRVATAPPLPPEVLLSMEAAVVTAESSSAKMQPP